MKILRKTLNRRKTNLHLKEGQIVFYIESKVFGVVSEKTDYHMCIDWDTHKDRPVRKIYSLARLTVDAASSLLDDCILCETDQDKLFVELKYGVYERKNS
jgi:hypothetical protein